MIASAEADDLAGFVSVLSTSLHSPGDWHLRVWHGTTARLWERIKAEGLRPREGCGPFVTTDSTRAAGFGNRAVCVDLDEDADAEPFAIMVAVVVDQTCLVPDPAHDGDFVLRGGCASTEIELSVRYDVRPYLVPGDVEELADITRYARTVEDNWHDERLGLDT